MSGEANHNENVDQKSRAPRKLANGNVPLSNPSSDTTPGTTVDDDNNDSSSKNISNPHLGSTPGSQRKQNSSEMTSKKPKATIKNGDKVLEYVFKLGRDPSLPESNELPDQTKKVKEEQTTESTELSDARAVSEEEISQDVANKVSKEDEDADTIKSDTKPSSRRNTSKRQKQDGQKPTRRKKRKAKPRGTSPVHFPTDPDTEELYGPKYTHSLPVRKSADSILRSVAKMYYGPNRLQGNDSFLDDYQPIYSTLEMLVSPLRKAQPMDSWSVSDVALFETGICKYGKDFYKIAQSIPGKKSGDVVNFYYGIWKHSQSGHKWRCRNMDETERKKSDQKFSEVRKATESAHQRYVMGKGRPESWVGRMRRGGGRNGTTNSKNKKRKRRR
eukprot:jgi/Bigna1/133290/aug1.20_g7998